ncbi:MAG: hypothetical protein M1831_001773 [Alyxoria varia]|nr:MAG: hypothetical protein M1831_001773 [Alyxoria varia]
MANPFKALSTWPYPLAIFVLLQSHLLYFLTLPSFLLFFIASTWISLRLYRVISRPVDDLVKLLGLEVPHAPDVSLLSIASHGVSLSWEPLEARVGIEKYVFRINGITVGEANPTDTAVAINGLDPATYYTIRVAASSSGGFEESSNPIRIRTLDPCDDHGTVQLPDGFDADQRRSSNLEPTITPMKPFKEAGSNSPGPGSLSKEHSPSGGQLPPREFVKRASSAHHDQLERRSSAAETSNLAIDSTNQDLTARLDSLRKETAALEKNDQQEEEQFQQERNDLTAQRDSLRNQLKEKEKDSKELSKSVTALQRQSTAAQAQRENQEKALQTRKNERQKLQDDVTKWDREVQQMRREAEGMLETRSRMEESNEKKVQDVVNARSEDSNAIRDVEEQIQATGKQIKELEESQKPPVESSDSGATYRDFSYGDDAWPQRLQELCDRREEAQSRCEEAQRILQDLKSRFNARQGRGASQTPAHSYNMSVDSSIGPSDYQFGPSRSMGQYNVGASSYIPTTLPASDMRNLYGFGQQDPSSVFNLDGLHSASDYERHASQSDMDHLTGGALPSPSAGLLPRGLLGDESEDMLSGQPMGTLQRVLESEDRPNIPRPRASFRGDNLSQAVNPLPGLGTVSNTSSTQALPQQQPNSPQLQDSRSPSLTSSPHDSISIYNHQQRFSEGGMESDRRSLASTSSRGQAPEKSSNIFGGAQFFGNRQRGKSTPDQGPLLGSLGSNRTSSMPRQLDSTSSESTNTGRFPWSKPNRFSVSKMQPSGFGFSRSSNTASTDQFPRPPSVYSAEANPRPSSESQPLGWNTNLGRSNTTRTGRQGIASWSSSAYDSRRGSVSRAQSAISQLDQESSELPPGTGSTHPPIGTKSKTQKQTENKSDSSSSKPLNPDAPSFRSRFTWDKRTSKKKDKDPSQTDDSSHNLSLTPFIETSPPDNPRSSNSLAGSNDDSAELGSIRTNLSESGGPITPLMSDEAGPPHASSVNSSSGFRGAGEFMKKLTSKSSSSKFSLGSLKTKSSGIGNKPASLRSATTASATDDGATDDDSAALTPGGARMGVSSSPQALSSGNGTPTESVAGGETDVAFPGGNRENVEEDAGKHGDKSSKRSSAFGLSSLKRRATEAKDKKKEKDRAKGKQKKSERSTRRDRKHSITDTSISETGTGTGDESAED